MLTASFMCPNSLLEAEQLKKEQEQFMMAIEVSYTVVSPPSKHIFAYWVLVICCFFFLFFFLKINFFKKIFQVCIKSVKQLGSRSGPTYCWA